MENNNFPLDPSLDEAGVEKIIVGLWNNEVQPKVSGNHYNLDVQMGGILEAEDVIDEGESIKKGMYFNPFIDTSLFKQLPLGTLWWSRQEMAKKYSKRCSQSLTPWPI